MVLNNIDFNKISQAINYSIEAINSEQEAGNHLALENLKMAKDELQQALSFSLISKY